MDKKLNSCDVRNEKEFRQLVKRTNRQIMLENQRRKDGIKEELIDMKSAVDRYRRIVRKERINQFRIEHDCRKCYYFQERKCWGTSQCLMENNETNNHSHMKKKPMKHKKRTA